MSDMETTGSDESNESAIGCLSFAAAAARVIVSISRPDGMAWDKVYLHVAGHPSADFDGEIDAVELPGKVAAALRDVLSDDFSLSHLMYPDPGVGSGAPDVWGVD